MMVHTTFTLLLRGNTHNLTPPPKPYSISPGHLFTIIKMNMDEQLMNFVNVLGLITFSSIVLYHFVVASPKDAEL